MSRNTLYDVLEVDRSASIDSIRLSYRALSKEHHPDVGGNRERFERLSEAHRVLSNPNRRRLYDQNLLSEAARAATSSAPAIPGNRQIVVDASGFDEPMWRSAARLVGVLAITGVLVALVIVPALVFWWRVDGTPEIVDARRATGAGESEPVQEVLHNGLSVDSTARRWLVAYQAFTGVSPQSSPEESRAVYADSAPGELCDAFSSPAHWNNVAVESDDIAAVSDAVNRDLARVVAECNNFETIVPALETALRVDALRMASRLGQIERFADEVAYTPPS